MNIIELKDHKENRQQENINEYLRRDENIAEIKKYSIIDIHEIILVKN